MKLFLPAILLLLTLATPASAAPVAATATLTIDIPGLARVVVGGAGTVDITNGILSVPAGLANLTGTLVVPVTGSTTVDNLSLTSFSNLSGVFSLGGMTAQAAGEICPGGTAIPNGSGGNACNIGGGIGGIMGLTGVVYINLVPNVAVPLDLAVARLGLGGSTNSPFINDAAGWSTGTGLINTGVDILASVGSSGAGGFLLVTPLFLSACGNVLPIFSALSIHLNAVPEPSFWVTLWAGLLGVVWFSRKR